MLGWAAGLPSFDFRAASDARQWRALHDLAPLEATPAGLVARITGTDPYFAGPARDFPPGRMLWLNVRLKSDSGGTCQVFYFATGTPATEPASVRFAVPGGNWHIARVPMPALGTSWVLRIDPPGDSGSCVFERLWFEERIQYTAPDWPQPSVVTTTANDPAVLSGGLVVRHNRESWGGFTVTLDGRPMAQGHPRSLIGYRTEPGARWWEFAAGVRPEVVREGEGIRVTVSARDPDGGNWTLVQRFAPGPEAGSLRSETSITVDPSRQLLYFPPLTLLAGISGGTNKQQALLAGVEYLDNEPSSSEADLEGPQARRQVTDTAKLTFPLAALVANDRYLGLIWEMDPDVAVVFDSPDRLFRSGGHLLGLLLPGSDGLNREEGSLVPYDTLELKAGVVRTVRATLIGGPGTDVTPALRQFVRLRGLPEVPSTGYTGVDFFRLAARGWLDSAIRDGNLYRHAVVGSFAAMPAADAAYQMEWLAGRVGDPALAERLRVAAAGASSAVAVNQRYHSGVGHVRFPVAPLILGAVAENAGTALVHGQGLLRRFEGPGTVRYVPAPGALNYGRTHWTNEANGLTAQLVVSVLEAAAFSGDRALAEAGLRHLRGLTKFRGSVPRGAQTWEVPLHTPDILASAHLVRAYTLGYEFTGESGFLDEARYWAWTGLPFVYLRDPTDRPVGRYATTPVLGATQWVAPNWIGLPVQWCGLVYADALHGLARHDPSGHWRTLADGIVASGVQQTYPASDPRYLGLLPDSFSLRAQQRNPANINPATVLARAPELFGAGTFYDSRVFRHHGVRVHAAGEVRPLREDKEGFAFRVEGWSPRTHGVLLTGLYDLPSVKVNGRETPLVAPHSHAPLQGRLILQIEGSATIEVGHPAVSALSVQQTGENVVSVRWPVPTGTASWILETAGSLLPEPSAWGPVAAPPRVEDGQSYLILPTAGDQGYFRLRRSGT